jgi:hypothetical protein
LQAERHEVTQVQRFLDDVRQNEAWERHKHLSAGFLLAKRIMLEQQGKSSFHLWDMSGVLLCKWFPVLKKYIPYLRE